MIRLCLKSPPALESAPHEAPDSVQTFESAPRSAGRGITIALLGLLFLLSHSCGGPVVSAPCEKGKTPCKDGCYDLKIDENNCGTCSQTCGQGESCLQGVCGVCEQGKEECMGNCIDPLSDSENCGGCGNGCGEEHECENGVCVGCDDGTKLCGGSCVDLQSNDDHCGKCERECSSEDECVNGFCRDKCEPPATVRCDNVCTDVSADSAHCGACDSPCPLDKPVCVNSRCEISCPDWMTICDGQCTNINYNPFHCGACRSECPENFPVCMDRSCRSQCADSLELCGRACVDTTSNPLHCGGCFLPCPPTHFCDDRECVLDCGNKTDCAGACIDTTRDRFNCGECGETCDETEICMDSTCELDCGNGSIECDEVCVNPASDRTNCGGCGKECGEKEVCENRECITDCGALLWCEPDCVDTQTNNDHCNGCNKPCDPNWYCVQGNCKLDCPAPFTACGANCVNLNSDPLNCKTCSNQCFSGICNDAECREESAGHLVAIGHDFMSSHGTLRTLIGNAVFISSKNPVKVLAYTEYADLKAGGQVAKVDSAIALDAASRGRSWQKTVAPNTDVIIDTVVNYDVLLVYAQGRATDADLNVVGNNLYSILHSFLSVGGIVIFTDGLSENNDGTWRLFDTADLFSCVGIYNATDHTASVIEPGDAVGSDLNTSYLAAENSVFFSSLEQTVVVEDHPTGNPLVIHKVFLPKPF